MNLTLVVMAAGIGSRYGGLKQMDPIGPSGEFIIDYSIHDAVQAGFDKVLFIIRRDIEHDFKSTIGARTEKKIKTGYIFQELDALPANCSVPPDRKKPWGTGHAVLICNSAVDGPFGVINADDFYGRESYKVLAGFLRETSGDNDSYGMVGFVLRNTLSEHGSVARGICRVDSCGNLESLVECTKIGRQNGKLTCNMKNLNLSGRELVSMNMWAFKPSIFKYLEEEFGGFLKAVGKDPKAEFYISDMVNKMMKTRNVRVRVLETGSSWFGITNPEDKPVVVTGIRKLVESGEYPVNLVKGGKE